jgi:hypothetical protein
MVKITCYGESRRLNQRSKNRMRTLLIVCVVLAGVLFTNTQGWAQETEDAEAQRLLHFGVGILATFAQDNEFPTGASARLWILRTFGLEIDIFTRENNPTFAIRGLFRFLDMEIATLYTGAGVAFFSKGLIFDSTLQAVLGIDIAITPNFIMSAEVGGILGGESPVPVSAAAGVHYYF